MRIASIACLLALLGGGPLAAGEADVVFTAPANAQTLGINDLHLVLVEDAANANLLTHLSGHDWPAEQFTSTSNEYHLSQSASLANSQTFTYRFGFDGFVVPLNSPGDLFDEAYWTIDGDGALDPEGEPIPVDMDLAE